MVTKRSKTRGRRLLTTRRELVLLLGASMGCVVMLTLAVTNKSSTSNSFISTFDALLFAAIGAASFAAIWLVWNSIQRARHIEHNANTKLGELRSELEAFDAVINSEPQVLMLWKRDSDLKVVSNTLRDFVGLPNSAAELVKFGGWLDEDSNNQLKSKLSRLFENGNGFNIILKTKSETHIEVEGRAASGRAIIRLRDVAGYRKDLANILDQHKSLAQDITTSQALLEALPMPVWLKDSREQIMWVNKAYVAAVEAESSDEVLKEQVELLEQRQRRALGQSLELSQNFQQRLAINIAGTRKAHDVIALKLDHATVAAAIDVAELETAQGELDRQVEAFDSTLDKVTTAVSMFSGERKLTYFNKAFEDLWQLDAEWLETSPRDSDVLDKLHELGRLPQMGNYRDWRRKMLDAENHSAGHDDFWHLADGRVLHVISERNSDGGFTFLYVDETERLALESRVNALSRVQGETLNALTEGVAVFATDGRLKLFNTAFSRIWHLSPQSLDSGPHINEIVRQARILHDDDNTWTNIVRSVTAFSNEREPIREQLLRPDNSVIDYSSIPLPDGATLLTFDDVTDEKRYERALVERNDALVASDKLKNQFVGHVSYELRTPLTNIIGFSDFLAEPHLGALNEKQREYLSDIRSSSNTLLAIIDDILDLATMDAGALELKLESLDVKQIVDAALEGVRDRAERKNLILDVAIADDAETFVGDQARIRQVLYNLLSNAVGFSHDDGVVLITCWKDESMTYFQVEDRGIGISKEDQERVFERFVTESKGLKHRGVGLGLSIVRSLVEHHGGEMILESEEGYGTRVTICLPERDTATMTPEYSVEEQRALASIDDIEAEEGQTVPSPASGTAA